MKDNVLVSKVTKEWVYPNPSELDAHESSLRSETNIQTKGFDTAEEAERCGTELDVSCSENGNSCLSILVHLNSNGVPNYFESLKNERPTNPEKSLYIDYLETKLEECMGDVKDV